MTKKSPSSAADRQRASRERRRSAGVPAIAVFDAALRKLVLTKVNAGVFDADLLDLLREVSENLTAASHASVLGVRETVLALKARAEG